jgi:hypothetical protein
VHTPYQAKALPFINVFSTAYRYGGTGTGCFNPATPYDTDLVKVAEHLTYQVYRAVQLSLQGATSVAPLYGLTNQSAAQLPLLPCRAVLLGEARLQRLIIFITL